MNVFAVPSDGEGSDEDAMSPRARQPRPRLNKRRRDCADGAESAGAGGRSKWNPTGAFDVSSDVQRKKLDNNVGHRGKMKQKEVLARLSAVMNSSMNSRKREQIDNNRGDHTDKVKAESVTMSTMLHKVLKGEVAVINAMQRRMSPASTPDKIFDHLWRFLHCSQRRVGTHYLPGSIEIFQAIDQAYSVSVLIRLVPVPLPLALCAALFSPLSCSRRSLWRLTGVPAGCAYCLMSQVPAAAHRRLPPHHHHPPVLLGRCPVPRDRLCGLDLRGRG